MSPSKLKGPSLRRTARLTETVMNEKSVVFLFLILAVGVVAATVYLLGGDGLDREKTPAPQPESETEAPLEKIPVTPEEPDRPGENGTGQTREKVPIEATDGKAAGGVLLGRVVTADNRPVAGAKVVLYRVTQDLFMSTKYRTGQRAKTGKDGTYRLEKVPSGVPLLVECTAAGHAASETSHPPIKPGAEDRVIDITMTSGFRITGTVTDRNGLPISGALIRARSRSTVSGGGEKEAASSRSDQDGRFHLDHLSSSSHEIIAEAVGYLPVTQSILFGFLGSQETESRLDFVLSEASDSIRGIVRSEKGKPVPGTTIRVSLTGGGPANRFTMECRTAKNGTFLLNGLSSGLYILTAESGGLFLKEPLQVQPSPDRVEIVLHRKGGVKGRLVADSDPPARFSIAVDRFVPRWPRTRLIEKKEFSVTRGPGFSLANLLPGTYVFVVKADGFAWSRSPDILVTSGQTTQDVEILLSKGGGLRGQLFTVNGRPIGGASLRLLHESYFHGFGFGGLEGTAKAEQGKTCLTRENGSFLLENIVPGKYSIEIEADGMATKVLRDILVEREAVRDLGHVALSTGGNILGNAVDENGIAARGTRVVAMDRKSGLFKSAVTDRNGFFQIKGLAAGQYIVYLDETAGALSSLRTDVTIQVYENETVRVDLAPRKDGNL